ncbi:MAG: hypothetical protein KAT74_07355 [Candidatus Cloacimonetes bacterium]|nr:hypothetical protein [Candidatus Cloacimonadota bacterium]
MVKGIEKFKSTFKDYNDQFILIGGTACDNLMDEAGLDFRATRDLDIVLIVELLESEFIKAFWNFIIEGGYEHKQKSSGKNQFYRFTKPNDSSFPFMIELFSRKLESFNLPEESTLTPIPAAEEITNLSAILLDDNYYDFIITHRIEIEDLPMVNAECLIPLKAKAWMDLSVRKERGENIKSRDIKKHKNDIIRLCQLLSAGKSISLPQSIRDDMVGFIKKYEQEPNINPKNLGIQIETDVVFKRLKEYYQLKDIGVK